jgi:hypothetical protein
MIRLIMLLSVTCMADSLRAIASLGYFTDAKVVKVIKDKAAKYGIKPDIMVAIAILESSMNTQASRLNSNGTTDYGLFQINSVNKTFCKEYDIQTLKGNAGCAAKLLALHRTKKDIDSNWYCRYHSKTPSKKIAYCEKLNKIRSAYQWEMKTSNLNLANK